MECQNGSCTDIQQAFHQINPVRAQIRQVRRQVDQENQCQKNGCYILAVWNPFQHCKNQNCCKQQGNQIASTESQNQIQNALLNHVCSNNCNQFLSVFHRKCLLFYCISLPLTKQLHPSFRRLPKAVPAGRMLWFPYRTHG